MRGGFVAHELQTGDLLLLEPADRDAWTVEIGEAVVFIVEIDPLGALGAR